MRLSTSGSVIEYMFLPARSRALLKPTRSTHAKAKPRAPGSRERSTGTPDREQAEIVLVEWLNLRGKRDGPTDPASIFVTDLLNHYLQQRGPKVVAPGRIAYAVLALTDFFEGNTVAEVTPQTCGRYVDKRVRSLGTVWRELGVLRAAINYAHKTRHDHPHRRCGTSRTPRAAR